MTVCVCLSAFVRASLHSFVLFFSLCSCFLLLPTILVVQYCCYTKQWRVRFLAPTTYMYVYIHTLPVSIYIQTRIVCVSCLLKVQAIRT